MQEQKINIILVTIYCLCQLLKNKLIVSCNFWFISVLLFEAILVKSFKILIQLQQFETP